MNFAPDKKCVSPSTNVYRLALKKNVAVATLEAGYDGARNNAVELMTDHLQTFFMNIAKRCTSLIEHTGRTKVTVHDVVFALVDEGFQVAPLAGYVEEHEADKPVGRVVVHRESSAAHKVLLQVGEKRKFPMFIPENYNYPPLPDPHTYIRTTTGVKPESDYAVLRDKWQTIQRDVANALTQFIARTNNSHPLFVDEPAYSLIVNENLPKERRSAMIPTERETITLEALLVQQKKNELENKHLLNEKNDELLMETEGSPSPVAIHRQIHPKPTEATNNPFMCMAKGCGKGQSRSHKKARR